ncbi:hypothetical protein D3C72_1794220 [compost metagenome]
MFYGLQNVIRLVYFFLRHRLHAQANTTARLPSFFRCQGLVVGHVGVSFRQSLLVARLVDHQQHLPFLDQLVIHQRHVGQQPGNVRRYRHHVGSKLGITRPGGLGVKHPGFEYGDDPQQDQNQSDRDSGYFY